MTGGALGFFSARALRQAQTKTHALLEVLQLPVTLWLVQRAIANAADGFKHLQGIFAKSMPEPARGSMLVLRASDKLSVQMRPTQLMVLGG